MVYVLLLLLVAHRMDICNIFGLNVIWNVYIAMLYCCGFERGVSGFISPENN